MAKYYALFNPFSNNGKGEEAARRVSAFIVDDELIFLDITKIKDYNAFFHSIDANDCVIICGGDGTLNRFLNDTYSYEIKNKILYFACGTGNDFVRDIGVAAGHHPVEINKYMKKIPFVTVKGKIYRFINNVGFGLDGYCTQISDKLRAAKKEKINYIAIALKGLLGEFKPVNATITVDGITTHFKKVWLAPTMKGRFYGGGVMPTPQQDRLNPDETLSLMLFHGKGRLTALTLFPTILKGTHVRFTKMVKVFTGKEISVKFDRPCALQIDGETILDVLEYHVQAESVALEKKLETVYA